MVTTYKQMRISFDQPAFLIALCVAIPVLTQAEDGHVLSSPDGRVQVLLEVPLADSAEKPRWSARFRGEQLLTGCRLGLATADSGELLAGARLVHERSRYVDERIPVLFGRSAHASDRFSETRFTLEAREHRRLDVVFRCYTDAIAVRYELPTREGVASVIITNESTSFRLEGEPIVFVQYLENFKTSHEHNVVRTPYREIRPGVLLDMPLTFLWTNSTYVAITEASLRHYAGMSLLRPSGKDAEEDFVCQLTPRPDGTKVVRPLPLQTPWRVVLVGDRPGALLESQTIYCLNDPPVMGTHPD
jgi:alpha-glucosidase